IVANPERCLELAESSASIVTPLNRYIGYENAAKIAKHAVKEKMTVKESALDLGFVERGEISEEDLDNALNVADMTHPKASK
ncbi:MAG: aspartate ammonia-lyase, partial [Varibaculum cambriense]